MDRALKIHELARAIVSRDDLFYTPSEDVDSSVFLISLGLFAKLFKLHGAMSHLVTYGYENEVDILIRTLLETSLALDFILMPKLVLLEHGSPLVVDPEKELSRNFRAKLYLAHQKFSINNSLRAKNAFLWTATRASTTEVSSIEEEQIIGPVWTQRLKKRRTFSGVSIADLAASVGKKDIFKLFYGALSRYAHGCDWSQHVETIDASGRILLRWQPKNRLKNNAFVAGADLVGAAAVLLTQELKIASPVPFAECLLELRGTS